jgi:hypothetical protein
LGIGHRAKRASGKEGKQGKQSIGSRKLKPSLKVKTVFRLPSSFFLLPSSFFIINRSQILGERKMHPLKADCQPKFVSFH